MANKKQLALLRKGVESWNAWREQHRGVEIDLTKANLAWANLIQANLSGADLSGADLSGAALAGANLSGAFLHGANLTNAHLFRAALLGASLANATLANATLAWADLTKVQLVETIFGNTNLASAKGLDSCNHLGPSTIDFQTLARSGSLPLAFLRGCGLPDNLIDYLPSLLNEPLAFYSCFISHSSRDQEFVERLHADLQDKGVRCYYAPKDIQSGKKIHEQIDQAIRVYQKLLLVLSVNSMNSEWVKTEIAKARQREGAEKPRVLFPIRLVDFEQIKNWKCFDADTGKDSAREIREYFIPDFSTWKDHNAYQKAFDQLLRDLKTEAEEKHKKA